MAMILASFDTKTGALMVTVDGNPISNVQYACLSKGSEGRFYASIESKTENNGMEVYQRMEFENEDDPKLYDESTTTAQIRDYFNRK